MGQREGILGLDGGADLFLALRRARVPLVDGYVVDVGGVLEGGEGVGEAGEGDDVGGHFCFVCGRVMGHAQAEKSGRGALGCRGMRWRGEGGGMISVFIRTRS